MEASTQKTINSLPNEVLWEVSKYLGRTDLSSLRLVNSRFKQTTDEFIENYTQVIHSNWKPTQPVPEPPFPVPMLQVIKGRNYVASSFSAIPPHVYNSVPVDDNPFPSKALVIQFGGRKRELKEGFVQIKFANVCAKWGMHLSYLVLSSLTLTSLQLHDMLFHTPNLKILKLKNIKLKIDKGTIAQLNYANAIPLPPLTKLKFMQLERITSSRTNVETKLIVNWILSAYVKQLVKLSVDQDFYDIGNIEANFLKLEDLRIWNTERSEMELIWPESTHSMIRSEHVQFPRIKRISLGRFPLSRAVELNTLERVQQFLGRFNATLEEVYLDFLLHFTDQPMRYMRDERNFKWSSNKIKFLNVKTLTIGLPSNETEECVLKDMLLAFPAVRKLILIRLGDKTFADIRQWATSFKIRSICKKLRFIKIDRSII